MPRYEMMHIKNNTKINDVNSSKHEIKILMSKTVFVNGETLA